ncbi:MAG: efflux RND transporter periplasmic adaptor subunit [Phycisphaera sp.]|nr:efflux RND transporter periplasmic adaptor subunit [Phycisphaera sp.]
MNTPRSYWLEGAALAVALAATFVSFGPAWAQGGPSGPPPANIRVGEALKEKVRVQRLVIGRIEPAKRSTVAAEQAGRVIISPKEPGLPVTEGEVLAKIDDTLLKIARQNAAIMVEQAEAQVADTQAQLSIVRRNRERLEPLVKSNVARLKELEDAQDQEKVYESRRNLSEIQVRQARNSLERIEAQLKKTEVVAPFDSIIVHKLTEAGQWADAGDPIVELVMTKGVKVRLQVPQSMIDQVPMDDPVTLHIDALGEDRPIKVFSIVPDADPQARTFSVLLKVPNADGRLKPGMSISAQLPTHDIVDAITVPKDAVQTTPTGQTVYVVRGGRALAVNVNVLFSHNDRFVIQGAIAEGDQVVTEGNENLRPGQPVNIQNATASAK